MGLCAHWPFLTTHHRALHDALLNHTDAVEEAVVKLQQEQAKKNKRQEAQNKSRARQGRKRPLAQVPAGLAAWPCRAPLWLPTLTPCSCACMPASPNHALCDMACPPPSLT